MVNRYLLGEVSAAEQEEIEKRYFTDPAFLQEVLAAEDDLIDAYVRDELPGRDRERFENHFARSAGRRQRVESARALMLISQASEPKARRRARGLWGSPFLAALYLRSPVAQLALAALLLAVLAAGAWLLVDHSRLRAELDRMREERAALERRGEEMEQAIAQQRAQNEKLAQDLLTKSTAPDKPDPNLQGSGQSLPRVASFLLLPGLSRSADEPRRLIVPTGVETLKLQLSVETTVNNKRLRAMLRRPGDAAIWRGANMKLQQGATGKFVVVKIPANLFTGGDYLVTLTATMGGAEEEVVGDYPFTIVRR